MIKAQIITKWTGSGTTNDTYRPLLQDLYPLESWSDMTGQPSENLHPDPDLYIIEATCEESVLTQIEQDDRFYVLWSEEVEGRLKMKDKSEKIGKDEAKKLKDWLKKYGVKKYGVKNADADLIVKESDTLESVSDSLREHFKKSPKKKE